MSLSRILNSIHIISGIINFSPCKLKHRSARLRACCGRVPHFDTNRWLEQINEPPWRHVPFDNVQSTAGKKAMSIFSP